MSIVKTNMIINTLVDLLSETEDKEKMKIAAPLHKYFSLYEGTPEEFLEEVATALVAATPEARKRLLGVDPLDEERKTAVELECMEYAFWASKRYEKYLLSCELLSSFFGKEYRRAKTLQRKTSKAVNRQIGEAFKNFSENEEYFGADNGFREWFGDEPESDL